MNFCVTNYCQFSYFSAAQWYQSGYAPYWLNLRNVPDLNHWRLIQVSADSVNTCKWRHGHVTASHRMWEFAVLNLKNPNILGKGIFCEVQQIKGLFVLQQRIFNGEKLTRGTPREKKEDRHQKDSWVRGTHETWRVWQSGAAYCISISLRSACSAHSNRNDLTTLLYMPKNQAVSVSAPLSCALYNRTEVLIKICRKCFLNFVRSAYPFRICWTN